jgi:hypothetical protein
MMGEMRYLRQQLADYTISVFNYQLEPYYQSADIQLGANDNILFIPLGIVKQGKVYTKNTGFQSNPEQKATTSIV